ncbi:MAG: aspartate 1-decarboxylase [Deferribacteres bacterium]|nr:aspartate 1-decarboxylase [Deferribacteres bacterium]
MRRRMLLSKIHGAIVTQANLNYVGSITIDRELMDAAGLLPYEVVEIWNITNGERFNTYVIEGEPGSGVICLNGAAARKVAVGDKVIIACYVDVEHKEAINWNPRLVFVDENNRIVEVKGAEQPFEVYKA